MKKLFGLTALLALAAIALTPSTAVAETNLAVICTVASSANQHVNTCPDVVGAEIYAMPTATSLVRSCAPALAGGGSGCDWNSPDFKYVPFGSIPDTRTVDVCVDDIPNNSTDQIPWTLANSVCKNWMGVPKAQVRVAAATPIPANSALMTWTPATQNDDGSPYTNPKGYFIYSGVVNPPTTKSALITPATVISKQFDNLAAGTWYFAITSVNTADIESAKSAVGSKVVASAAPKPTVTMSVTPRDGVSSVTPTIAWGSTGATGCVASGGWTGAKAVSGSAAQAKVTVNTTYTLACTGPGGTTTISSDVTVSPRPNAPAVTVR